MAAADALLDLFQLEVPQRDVYRIGQYSPVSVRDQVVRAIYLVERLWATRRLTAGSQLLVVGAGAAGVTVALEAVALGVKQVVVADLSDRVLSLQAPCTSRWVDPAQYDWPAHHWDGAQWPIFEPPVGAGLRTAQAMAPPVSLRAGYATAWSSRFDRYFTRQQALGSIDFRDETKVTLWTQKPGSNLYVVDLEDAITGAPASPATVEADVIIFAGGFGQERTSVEILSAPGTSYSYVGTAFWGDDKYEQPDFGLGTIKDGVLVSGTGDGSLQDYIRLVTGRRTAGEVWDAVQRVLPSQWRQEFNDLAHWEDHARRSSAFAPDYLDLCSLLERLQFRYEELLVRLARSKDWRLVARELGRIVQSRPVDKVFLAQKGSHFDSCYPLNRLVALLLLRYLHLDRGLTFQLLPNTAVKSVALPSGATAFSDVQWGTAVDVELAEDVDCRTTQAQIMAWAPTKTRPFDGVVIRHGIDTSTLIVKASKLKPQMVPPHLP